MMNLDQARCNWRTQTSGSNWIDKSFRRDTLFPGAISRPADAESGAIVDAIMDVIKQALAAWKAGLQARLVAVALFGSRARGEERPGSDWDLFVLAESLPQDPLDRQLYLKSMLPLWPASKVSVLAKTPAEFEKELLSVYLDIAADGVLIFDPHKYLGPRLEQVGQIARNAGLQRRRWKGEWVWKWKDSPRPGWEVNWQ